MPFCFVPQCSHSSARSQSKCSFFRLPRDEGELKKWTTLMRRQDAKPNEHSRVCSCHFRNGKKEAGPTLFAWNDFKRRVPADEVGDGTGGAAAVAAPSPVTLLEQAQRRASELEAALAKKSAELEQVKSQHSAEEAQMRSVLTENQLTMLKTGRRPHRWDDESVIKAMGIRTSTSKRVYEYLREQQGWPLPSIRSISSWVSGLRIEPSSMAQFLQFLQVAAAETAPLAKNCAILFDEMSVDTRLCYDQQRDVIVGPHKQAQVIMVRSICGAWKQPVYVAFDTAISPEILMQLILSLEEMGYPVRAVVSDMGSKNVGLWRALGVSYDGETSIANPAAADRRVWFFADVPHCLKNLRNHILDDGLYLGCGGDRGDPVVDSDLMEELAREVSATEFTVNRKLTALHVHAAKGDRQRVYLAAQLLSETVAKSIPEVFEGQEKAAEVINIIDSGFDVLNSRRRYADKPLRCGLGVHLTEQLAALRKLEELLLTARFGSRKTLLPFQQGFLLSIRSTLALYKEMEKVDGFQFLQTALLNQDALESLFSSVRTKFGSNLNPTPTELLYRLRLLLIGASPAAARQTSVRPASLPEEGLLSAARAGRPPQCGTEDEFVVPIFSGYDATTISSTTIAPSVDQLSAATPPEPAVPVELLEEIGVPPNGAETETSQAISEYGMQYAAGFVAAKRAKVDPTLGTRTCDMAEEDVPSGARWIYLLSRGHLTVPSEQWLENFKEFEVVFCAIHRGQGMARRNGTLDQLSRAPGVVKTLSDTLCLRWPRLDERVISLYARLRTFIRLRHVAKVRRGDHLAALAEAAARRSEKPTPTPVVGTRRQFVKARQFARGAVYL